MSHTVITIARQYGSGGKTIGKMLAENVGIHFYNREIIRLASDESGINERLFGAADEQPKSGILGRIAKKCIPEMCFRRTAMILSQPIIYLTIRQKLSSSWPKKNPASSSDGAPIMC